MIILPMAEEVARVLGLPRHLIGTQTRPGETPETRSHVNYSDQVKDKLNGVMDDYLDVLSQKGEDHPAPPNDLSRTKLETCSKQVYESIKKFGAAQPGEPLSRMSADYFK